MSDDPIPIIEFDQIDSTNSEAMRRAASGERGPVWFRSDRQITGRGRSGRAWSSPPGNLSATLMFVPGAPIEVLYQLSLVTGVAMHDAVSAAFIGNGKQPPPNLRLKWPNDVLIGNAKLAGILIESTSFGGKLVAMIGCGLNITVIPPIDNRIVTRLADHGVAPPASEFLEILSQSISKWLRLWNRGQGFPGIRAAWLERAGNLGGPMSIQTAEGETRGRFSGIDPEGALLLADETG
ncbi:MAG TPA: biotin--[acetyl-CoA-carboxylase] ligase, partial [Hyphomicrobiaceae bacterium]|nr:biotin--[acetyl-CoA-carboxylase] ligase [Hyphomicrobiaceae bacterium]